METTTVCPEHLYKSESIIHNPFDLSLGQWELYRKCREGAQARRLNPDNCSVKFTYLSGEPYNLVEFTDDQPTEKKRREEPLAFTVNMRRKIIPIGHLRYSTK